MLWCVAFFNYADRQAIFSVFPLLEKEMNLSPIQLGLLGSSFAWTYGIVAPIAGNIVDRVKRTSAVLWGLHLWSVICAATALSRNFGHLLIFRAAEGLGESFYFPASMSLISDYHGKRTRSRAMGLHQTSVYCGTIAGGFFAGLIGQHYGWRLSFVVFGVLGVLLGIVLGKLLREPKRGAADLEDAGLARGGIASRRLRVREIARIILTTPSAVLLMLAFILSNFVAMVFLVWMPKFIYDKFSLSLAMAGLTATAFGQSASMLGAPIGGWIADSLRRNRPGGRMIVQAFAMLCQAPFVVLCSSAASVPILIVALALWGFFKGLYDSNIFASLFDVVAPETRGTVVGFMNLVGWLAGAGTAPVAIGFLAQRYSLDFAIAVSAVGCIAAGALLLTAAFVTAPRDTANVVAALQ